MKKRMTVNIIGRGNVAYHLNMAYKNVAEIIEVNPHTLEELNPEAEITIISVTDSAIAEILERLPPIQGVVAHTSGSTPIDIFKGQGINNFGVFYPLQTFSKAKALNYKEIPFYIEGSDEKTAEILFNFASLISNNVRLADSSQRKSLHIAAVFSCNFVNHLWTLSEKYLKEEGLQFSDLIPLIKETMEKIMTLSPSDAQTGPAVRGDINMIQSHLQLLEEFPNMKNIYKLLSESIINN